MVPKDATGGAARMIVEFERIELEKLHRRKFTQGQIAEPVRGEIDRSAGVMAPRERADRDGTGPLKVLFTDTFNKVWTLLLRSTSTGIVEPDAAYNRTTAQEVLGSWYGTRWILEPVLTSCHGASEIVLTSISKSTSNGLLNLRKLRNRITTRKILHDGFETRNSLIPILEYCSGAWQTILEHINILLNVLKKGLAAVPEAVVWASMGLIVIGIFITEFERKRATREQALRERIERERAEREQAARQEMQSFVTWIAILSILAIIGAGICFYKISVYNNEARNEQVQTFNYSLNRSADRVVRAIGSHEEAVDRMSGAIKSHGGSVYDVSRAIAYHGKAVDNIGRQVRYLGDTADRYTEMTTEYRSQRQRLLEAPPVENRAAKWDRREKKVRIAATVGKLLMGGITGVNLGS